MIHQTHSRYGPLAQIFHWVMAVLVLVAFIYGPGGSETRVYSSARDADRQLHETLGLVIFGLAALRLLWRMIDRQPDPPDIPRWMDTLSKAVPGLLYVLMFLLPISAVTGAWLEGHPLTLLRGVEIGPVLAPAHDIVRALRRCTPGSETPSCGSPGCTQLQRSFITWCCATACSFR
jgi:cytochrome b561